MRCYKTVECEYLKHKLINWTAVFIHLISSESLQLVFIMKRLSPIVTVMLLCYTYIQHVNSNTNERVGVGTYIPRPRVPNGAPCGVVIQEYIKHPEADPVQTVTPPSIQRDGITTKEDVTATDTPVGSNEEDATSLSLRIGRKKKYPAGSCSEIRDYDPSASSRNYWLKGGSEPDAGKIYCDYDFVPPPILGTSVFNSSGLEVGWMKLLDLDMRRPHSHCPEGLLQMDSPRRACANSDGYGCNSLTFSTHGVPYRRVCGVVSGFQYHTPDAFLRYGCPSCENNISAAYLDGVSITYGSPRTHIWSYTAAWSEHHDHSSSHPIPPKCPCAKGSNLESPDFVGQDYYCEQGGGSELWAGEQCGPIEHQHLDLPWFCKELSERTTQDMEIRLCIDQGTEDENVFVEMIQLLVQ